MTGQAPRLVFRFTQVEVDKMEEVLRDLNAMPKRPVVQGITDEFNSSTDRSGDGKVPVQYNQVRNWFQNRRSAQSQQDRTTMGASPPPQGKMMLPTVAEEHNPVAGSYSGNISSDGGQVQFEAKSARNGQWYDVAAFLSNRPTETRDPVYYVRFTSLGPEEDEWVDVCKCVRVRSLQCVDVLPGDHILCFKEGKKQDLYFDAHVLQVQRHDVRGCRCRFLVCYDHDHSEEVVPLRNICRRPEHQKAQQPQKMIDVNTDKVTGGGVPIPPDQGGPSDKPVTPLLDAPSSTHSNSVANVEVGNAEAAPNGEVTNEAHGDKMNVAESSFASLCIAP